MRYTGATPIHLFIKRDQNGSLIVASVKLSLEKTDQQVDPDVEVAISVISEPRRSLGLLPKNTDVMKWRPRRV